MTYNEILVSARGEVGPFCKACPVCDGRACGNSIPGPGCKAPNNTAERNYTKWQQVLLNMDTLCENKVPSTEFHLFGHVFKAPIFCAPMGSLTLHYGDKYDDFRYNSVVVPSAASYGIAAFTGDGVDPLIMKQSVEDMVKVQGIGIPTIKPWNKEAVFEKLDILNNNGIFAAAMDVDGAGLPFLKALNPNAGSKSVSELKEITSYAQIPFIVKGIMTPRGAEKAMEAGASAIVVSNHGGRVQGGVPATAEVLPSIAKVVRGQIPILVDGGIRTGSDVFRALALGADAVLIGRPIIPFVYAAGAEGLKVYLDKIVAELQDTMTMCGTPELKDIGPENVVNLIGFPADFS